VQRVVRNAVPRIADFSLLYVVDGGFVVCAASAHATRDGDRLVRTLGRVHRVKRSDAVSSVAQVTRTGQPLLRTRIRLDARRADTPADNKSLVAELHRRLAPRSALVVPVIANDMVLGAISLCYSESGRRYTSRDLPAASQVAREIGRLLSKFVLRDATIRLRPAARGARQGAALRRRVVSRD
jgi:GAF domain-containing protein